MALELYTLEIEIIPGILEQQWDEIEKKIEQVSPFAKTIHLDLLDGKFAPNTTFLDPEPFKKYTKDILFELHMMVEEPIQYIKPFANAGFQRFIGHIEKMSDIPAFVAEGQLYGEIGLAIDGPTPLEQIGLSLETIEEDLDMVMVFTAAKAGFSNQPFAKEMLEKVQKLREKNIFIPIEIDGGVNDQTILEAKKAGATRFVSTGFLYSGNPKEQYEKLQKAIEIKA